MHSELELRNYLEHAFVPPIMKEEIYVEHPHKTRGKVILKCLNNLKIMASSVMKLLTKNLRSLSMLLIR